MLESSENREQGGMDNERNNLPSGLNKGQKIAVAVLAVFALFIMIMWTVQFQKGLTSSFAPKEQVATNDSADDTGACTSPECEAKRQEAQKAKDTDGDGLNDYDELNVYHTSPYLEDSDSDGILDGNEVKNGTDPNCPQGKDCYKGDVANIGTASSSPASANFIQQNLQVTGNMPQQPDSDQSMSNLLQQIQAADQISNLGSGSTQSTQPSGQTSDSSPTDTATLEKLMNGQLDAKTLRQLLIEHGMKKEDLDKISDEQLMQSFSEMIQSGQ